MIPSKKLMTVSRSFFFFHFFDLGTALLQLFSQLSQVGWIETSFDHAVHQTDKNFFRGIFSTWDKSIFYLQLGVSLSKGRPRQDSGRRCGVMRWVFSKNLLSETTCAVLC